MGRRVSLSHAPRSTRADTRVGCVCAYASASVTPHEPPNRSQLWMLRCDRKVSMSAMSACVLLSSRQPRGGDRPADTRGARSRRGTAARAAFPGWDGWHAASQACSVLVQLGGESNVWCLLATPKAHHPSCRPISFISHLDAPAPAVCVCRHVCGTQRDQANPWSAVRTIEAVHSLRPTLAPRWSRELIVFFQLRMTSWKGGTRVGDSALTTPSLVHQHDAVVRRVKEAPAPTFAAPRHHFPRLSLCISIRRVACRLPLPC